jgi:hypothetical protein
MNWYKKAQAGDLGTLIVGWLRSARDQDLYVPDLMNNMDSLSGSMMADPNEIYQSAQQASIMVANEQGGQLTLTQQNLLNQLATNVSTVPEEPEVME